MSYHRDPTADPYLLRGAAGGGRGAADSDSDTDSEADAFRLRDDDLLILAARNEDDVSHLEVWGCLPAVLAVLFLLAYVALWLVMHCCMCLWMGMELHLPACSRPPLPVPVQCPCQVWVYEEADERGPANLYVHHSVMLPAFPLSVAWMDCDPSGKVGGCVWVGRWVGGWGG